jgi:hypothetical protein
MALVVSPGLSIASPTIVGQIAQLWPSRFPGG